MSGPPREKYKSRTKELLKGTGLGNQKKNTAKRRASSKPIKLNRYRKGNGLFIRIYKKARKIKPIPLFILCILLGLSVLGIFRLFFSNNSLEVFVNETSVGKAINMKLTDNELIKTLTAKLEEENDSKIKINENIKLVPARGKNDELLTDDALVSKLTKSVTYDVEAATIYINDKAYVTLADKKTAEGLLNQYKNKYVDKDVDPKNTEVSFVEKVEIKQGFVEDEKITTPDNAINVISETVKAEGKYKVAKGDYLSTIAAKHGMSLEEVCKINGITPDTIIGIGKELNVVSQKPVLSVKSVTKVVSIEPIPMPVEEQEDASYSRGVTSVVKQGKDGKKEVTRLITKINNVKQDEQKEEKILEQPVAKLVIKGTGS